MGLSKNVDLKNLRQNPRINYYFRHTYLEAVPISGVIEEDVTTFLTSFGYAHTLRHSRDVAQEASRLAHRFGENQALAKSAGLLHDISAVVPNSERIALAKAANIPILSEEAHFPMLLHQKISAFFAGEIFGISEPTVLNAIGCHTTLKAGASQLDKILFLADKMRWDQDEPSPYVERISAALDQSLEAAALVYLNDLLEQLEAVAGTIHPWARQAREFLHEALHPAI
jgi:predicted HD superfamily hydrolase involved in NAD metabolism